MESETEFRVEDWDEMSETSTMHLSYLVQLLLPLRLVGWKNAKRHYENIIRGINNSKQEDSNDDFIVSGSIAEGYAIPNTVTRTNPPTVEINSDVDTLWINGDMIVCTKQLPEPNDTEFKGYFDQEGLHPGYTRICLPHTKEKDDTLVYDEDRKKYYLSSTILMEKILTTRPKWDIDAMAEAWIQGPALTIVDQETITVANMDRRNIGISRDLVITFACFPWPDIANGWKERARKSQWLQNKQSVVNAIIKDGCHVVGVPSKVSVKPEIEWRMSFSASEGKLAREAVTDNQRQCYIYLKILRQQVKKPDFVLSSYVFKSVFLHCCEKLPVDHWKDYPASCVLYMLDVLMECLMKKHVPTYFLPENNLIDHLSDADLEEALSVVQILRLDPINPVLEFTDSRTLGLQPTLATFRETVKPLLEDMANFKEHRNREMSVMNGIMQTCYNIIHFLLHESCCNKEAELAKHQEAVRCMVDLYTLWFQPMGLDATLSQFINSAGLALKDVNITINYFEAATSLAGEYPEFNIFRGNLACSYHSAAYSHPADSEKREKYIKRAGEIFKVVYEETESGAIDFVTYLIKQGKNTNALKILENMMANLDKVKESVISYDLKELNTLEEPLSKHVEQHSPIRGDTVSFAYFYMVKCLMMMEPTKQNQENIERFIDRFEAYCKEKQHKDSFMLLEWSKSLVNEKQTQANYSWWSFCVII